MLMEADLPNDVEALRALVLEQSRTLATERAARADLALAKGEADAEIERLQSIIEAFMRHRFGRKSEQLDPDQLQLGLEDVETALGQARAAREAVTAKAGGDRPRKANRGALPAHLERIEQVVDVEEVDGIRACPCCGGALHQIGEDVAERLDVVPTTFRVLVTRRPRYGCRSCEGAVVQAPAPARIVEGGIPTELADQMRQLEKAENADEVADSIERQVKVGRALAATPAERTGLERESQALVWRIALGAGVLSAAVVASYAVARGDWLGGLLAGLTLAMAILPNELPAVLTVFLALGCVVSLTGSVGLIRMLMGRLSEGDRRRSEFLRACPNFVIVDEAHTCAATGQGRHQRYELLKGLSESPDRHLVLITATPHSGDDAAFYRLLGLLERDFEQLVDATSEQRTELRERLSRHFVQRRRPDIAEWKEGNLFPRRETKELTYKLTGSWDHFFDSVLDYCAAIVDSAAGDQRR